MEHGAGVWIGGAQTRVAAARGLSMAVFHYQNAARQRHFKPLRQGGQIGRVAQPLARHVVVAAYGEHSSGGRCQRFHDGAGANITSVYSERAILSEFGETRIEHAMGVS